MPLYLSRFSYTPETWAGLIGNPEDRRKAAQEYIESVGGKLHGFWYAFGEHDGVGGPGQRVHGRGGARDRGRWCAELARDDGPSDRRRDDGRPAQGPASPVPRARRIAARARPAVLRRPAETRPRPNDLSRRSVAPDTRRLMTHAAAWRAARSGTPFCVEPTASRSPNGAPCVSSTGSARLGYVSRRRTRCIAVRRAIADHAAATPSPAQFA
jgi:GYD domain